VLSDREQGGLRYDPIRDADYPRELGSGRIAKPVLRFPAASGPANRRAKRRGRYMPDRKERRRFAPREADFVGGECVRQVMERGPSPAGIDCDATGSLMVEQGVSRFCRRPGSRCFALR